MNNAERYWKQFTDSSSSGISVAGRYRDSFFFGFSAEDAPEVSRLVLEGAKTATGSVLWSYEADGQTLPQVGDFWVVTKGGDDPVCVIQTTEVRILPFDEVGEEYARDGGEGDCSLGSWREMYWEYIVSECSRIGREPSRKAPLVMERFQVVYRERLSDRLPARGLRGACS